VCEDCGLRYSDKGTLNAHKQTYCSKKTMSNVITPPENNNNILSNSIASYSNTSTITTNSSSTSSKNSSASNSRSNSPSINNGNKNSSVQSNFTPLMPFTTNTQNVQLLKSVIFQCNNCLFQTDKKSIMNRHSRVHLPQKRKQMEENVNAASNNNSLSTDQSESLLLPDSLETAQNDKTKAYCKECDIQFSSIKTFLHHRNNYCQKYKTIEAIVPVEVVPTTPAPPKTTSTQIQKKVEPQATIKQKCLLNPPSDNNNPLDLSFKKTKPEPKIPIQFMKPQLASPPPQLQPPATIDILNQYNLLKLQHLQNLGLLGTGGTPPFLPPLLPQNQPPAAFYPASTPLPLHILANSSNTDDNINKIFHCKRCQQLFLKFIDFKQHKCNLAAMNSSEQPKIIISSEPINTINLKSNNTKRKFEKVDQEDENDNDDDNVVLRHPLVKKTLIELYGSEQVELSDDSSSSIANNLALNNNNNSGRNFFMCTNCGYRGNTCRGVKQHGKLHLCEKQHFAVIQATDLKPFLIYNSETECDFSLSKYQQQKSLAIQKIDEEKLNKQQQQIKIMENDEEKSIKDSASPISKKARLLFDYRVSNDNDNANEEKSCQVDQQDSEEIVKKQPSAIKSQTYCFKCEIQFQHMNNFLAHKKSYCKDQ
jgi:hypothetical protein